MKLISNSFKDDGPIPGEFAFAVPAAKGHITLSANRNPHLAWGNLPPETQSIALIMHDPDVPSRGDDVNQEGRTVPADLPRVDFFHWVLVDLPPTLTEIAAGEFCNGVSPRGKGGPHTHHGARQGINDYTGWFAGDPDMAGDYYGYDGPCPPWNDTIKHHYIFNLYALDIATLPLEGKFTGHQVHEAIRGHVLAKLTLTGTYSLNPDVKA